MPLEIHREPLVRRYYVSYFSWSIAYTIVYGFLLVFLPLIIAYNSSGFWLGEKTTLVQPKVKYTYNSFLEVFGAQSSTGNPVSLYYSTVPSMNELYGKNMRPAVLKSTEYDDNGDGLTDRLEFNINMPLQSGEDIHSFNFGIHSDVSLYSTHIRYSWDDVMTVQYTNPISFKSVSYNGNVNIRQRWALGSKGGMKYISEKSLVNLRDIPDPASDNIEAWATESAKRNLSMALSPNYVSFVPKYGSEDYDHLTIAISLSVPSQVIRFFPTLSEVLKQAWIQYIAFFIVTWFILQRINDFIFRHKLVPATAVCDIMYEKTK